MCANTVPLFPPYLINRSFLCWLCWIMKSKFLSWGNQKYGVVYFVSKYPTSPKQPPKEGVLPLGRWNRLLFRVCLWRMRVHHHHRCSCYYYYYLLDVLNDMLTKWWMTESIIMSFQRTLFCCPHNSNWLSFWRYDPVKYLHDIKMSTELL